jgi:hypothetical protein
MHALNTPSGDSFGKPWASEAAMEIGLALAAAAFTVVVWLSSSAATVAEHEAMRATATGQPDAAKRVTLATVLVRGR